MSVVALVTAVELPLIGVGPTPLRMLLTLLLLTVIVMAVVVLLTLVGSKPIDKKWPPDEPLDPTEMLWGEVGGFVQKSFAGLDLNLARDLASYMDEVKVPADSWIVQYGDPASHYYVLKKGQAELHGGMGQPTGPIATSTGRPVQEGEGFGDYAIRHRTLSDIGVHAVTECVVLKLAAADYIAALTVSAATDQGPLLGQSVAPAAAVAAPGPGGPPPPPAPPSSSGPNYPAPPPPPAPPPSAPPGATSF